MMEGFLGSVTWVAAPFSHPRSPAPSHPDTTPGSVAFRGVVKHSWESPLGAEDHPC